MTLQLDIPDALARQAREHAERQHVSVDQLVATALTAQLNAATTRPSVAERARRVDWQAVDAILAKVPDVSPLSGDEL